MYRTCLPAFLCLLSTFSLFAQQKDVSGIVRDAANGQVMPGVTVVVEGTTTGTLTDVEGTFVLSGVQASDMLQFSFIGYESVSIPVGNQTMLDVEMEISAELLGEIVVTTVMGMKREKKTLGYATQELGGDEVAGTGQEDISRALQGKVAGVVVRQSSGMPGAGSQITIRGNSSLVASNQPLFVIDGVPVESGQSFTPGTSGTDASSRSMDINPNDIETINVLKGPTAAALYGLRASNGVVVITTKSGQAARIMGRNTVVTLNTNFSADWISRTPAIQNEFAQGNAGELNLYSASSWGPRIDTLKPYQAQEEFFHPEANGIYDFPIHGKASNEPARYDNINQFFRTGFSLGNNVDIANSLEKGTFSIGLGHNNQLGIIPNTGMDKYNTKLNGMFDLSEKLNMGVSVNYSQVQIDKVPAGNSASNPLFTVYLAPVSYDLKGTPYEDPDNPYIQKHYRTTFDNPYWSLEHNQYKETTQRIFGNYQLGYEVLEWLSLQYRIGIDYFTTVDKEVQELGSAGGRAYPDVPGWNDQPGEGQITDRFFFNNELNSNLQLNFSKRLHADWRIDGVLGNEIYDKNYVYQIVQGSPLGIGGFHNILNTTNQITANLKQHKRGFGYFVMATVDFRGLLFITPSGRLDRVSNMPPDNRTFFYPGIAGSFVFTELDALQKNRILPYGKLRLSYAAVGQDGDPYSTHLKYVRTGFSSGFLSSTFSYPYNDLNAYSMENVYFSDQLKPQNTKTFEAGFEVSLLEHRLGVDYTFYVINASDQIFRVPMAPSTGYLYEYMNAGNLKTNGHELMFRVKVVQQNDFSWKLNLNFSSYMNKVEKLADGVERIDVGGGNFTSVGTFAYEGQEYPVIYGTSYLRDDAGRIVVDARPLLENGDTNYYYGMPLAGEQKVLGKVNPDFELGVGNTISYKNLSLSFQIDWRQGGYMHSGLNALMLADGMLEETESRDELTVLDDAVKGYRNESGELVIQGSNDIPIYKGEHYYSDVLWNITEATVYSTTFVRLREVALHYQMPDKWFRNTFLSKASLFVSGRNLLLWTKFPHFDPETSTASGSGTGGFEYVSLPNTKSLGGGFRLTF